MVVPSVLALLLSLAPPQTPRQVPAPPRTGAQTEKARGVETGHVEPPDSEKETELLLISGLQAAIKDHTDVKIQVARNLRAVNDGSMDAPRFFAELAKMRMPRGLEPRHLLQSVKKDIGDHLGKRGLNYFLGVSYATGGSPVEAKLLTWRQNLVKETIHEVVREFSFGDLVLRPRYRIFMLEVGSWSGRKPEQLTFAGDIDFSFLCGSLEVSMQLKRAFDQKILAKTGLSPEALDVPCTANGMATPEVFVGKHGQGWAERGLDVVWEALPGAGLDDKRFNPQEALDIALLEGKLARRPLPDVKKSHWPGEPGESLEMIRHFEHDIVTRGVTGDMDSFLKACKYLRRSNQAVVKGGGAPSNPRLAAFAERMVGLKEDKERPVTEPQLVEEIRSYFRGIGEPIPLYVKLGPENAEGQRTATLEVKKEIIEKFWASCSTEMWGNVRKGFGAQIDRLRSRAREVTFENAASVRPVADELSKLREMVEVEMRVLEDPTVGVHQIPADVAALVKEFRSVCKDFMVKAGPNFLSDDYRNEIRFLDEMIKAGQPSSLRLAVGAVLAAPEKINGYLDVLDDKLMGELRGETPEGWDEFLAREREARWAGKVRQVSEGQAAVRDAGPSARNAERQRLLGATEEKINKSLRDTVGARVVRGVNQSFNRSIRESAGGQAVMKGLVLVSLKDEIPAYVHALAKGQWRELGVEFFRRRVPFGVVVEDLYKGDYLAGVWDSVATLVPPLALFETALRIGEEMGRETWKIAWDEALTEFIDGLYDAAVFAPRGAEQISVKVRLTNWELIRVSYRGQEVEVAGFVDKKRVQVGELMRAASDLTKKTYFPIEYTSDGITGWFHVDEILRESVLRKDPWLVMIEEMKKDPHAGPDLKDHYHDLWLARWEALKLEFFIRLVRTLEERRSATQLQVDGQAFEMFEELKRTAASLQIQKHVLAALEEETGSEFLQTFYGIWDYLRGTKRSLTGGPGVWDTFDEKVRVFSVYLRVYKGILDARSEAEKGYPPTAAREDRGLRLLTGVPFLKGKASADEQGAARWASLPKVQRSETERKLLEIKHRYVPGSALETTPESFDRKMTVEIAQHSLWTEMWTQTRATAAGDQLAASPSPASQKPPTPSGASAESAGADPAPPAPEVGVERVRHHMAESDRLLKEFEAHYFEDRAALLLEELRKLSGQADGLAQAVAAGCADAAGELARLQAEATAQTGGAQALASRLSALASRSAQVKTAIASILQSREEAERGVKALAEYSTKMEKRSLALCEATKAMQIATTAEIRGERYREIESLKSDLGPWLNECRNKNLALKAEAKRARADFAPVASLKEELAALQDVDGLESKTSALEKGLATASAGLAAAAEKAGQIAPILARIDQIAGQVRSVLEPMKEVPKSLAMLDEVERRQKSVESGSGRAQAALRSSEGSRDAARAAVSALRTLAGRIGQDRAEIRRSLQSGGGDSLTQARKEVESAEYLAELGADLLTRIENAATDGAMCVTLASDLNARPFAGRAAGAPEGSRAVLGVPSVVGMAFEDAMNALSRAGFVPDARSIGDALKAQDAFRVTGQKPSPNESAAPGTTVVIYYLGGFDVQAALAAANCPGVYPGSVPAFNQQSGQVECACPGAWSADRKVCLDCNVQQNGFYGALNSGDFAEANGILAQSVNCAFFAAANQLLWTRMQESYQQNAAEIQRMEAQRQAAEAEARRRKQEQLMQAIDGFGQALRGMTDAARPKDGAQPVPPPPGESPLERYFRQTGQTPPSPWTREQLGPPVPPRPAATPSAPTPPGRAAGGRSNANCEQQYCPMCAKSVDLLGTSLDPQCMECRRSKANLIAECNRGGAAPSVPEATPNTYYVGCQLVRDASGSVRCGPHKIGKLEELLGYEIIFAAKTWGECWNWDQANWNYVPKRR